MQRRAWFVLASFSLMGCQGAAPPFVPAADAAASPQRRVLASADTSASAPTVTAKAAEREFLGLTLYTDFALVQDARRAQLPAGQVRLRFDEVLSQLEPTTPSLTSTPGGFRIAEQSFDQNVLTPGKLLDAYVGKEVEIRLPPEGDAPAKIVKATLVSTNDGPIYRIGDRYYPKPPGEVLLPSLPSDLPVHPMLSWLLEGVTSGLQRLEARYQSGGLSWQCTHSLVSHGERGTFSSQALLKNDTDVDFPDAQLSLIAGKISPARQYFAKPAPVRFDASAGAETGFSERSFADARLFSLDRRVSLPKRQSKQLPLFPKSEVAIAKRYDLETNRASGDAPVPAQVMLTVENTSANGLGHALPGGTLRVYQDDGGTLRLAGETTIPDTPAGIPVRASLGDAFDVTGRRVQTSVKQISEFEREESYSVDLANARSEGVTVSVVERPFGDWSVVANSAPFRRVSANELRFDVPVGAKGKATLTYTLRIKTGK